jgi:GNAT superfamily N-acetyltransferase
MSLRVRPAEAPDLTTIGALHARSRADAYAGLVSTAALTAGSAAAMGDWWTERWRWEQQTHRLAVAELNGAVVGFSYAGPSETPAAVELYAIHVDPGHVGTGIGAAMMADALRALAQLATPETTRAVLWVLTGNARARRFYERGGWVADGAARDSAIGPELTQQVRYARALPGAGDQAW